MARGDFFVGFPPLVKKVWDKNPKKNPKNIETDVYNLGVFVVSL